MSAALAPGMQLTVVAGVANLTFLQNRVADNQSLLLNGCVDEWRKSIRNVSWWLFNRGLFKGSTLPPPDSHPAALGSRLHGTSWGLLAEAKLLAKLGGSAATSGGWLTTANRGSKLRSRASKSLSLASIATNTLHLLHVPLLLREAEE